MRNRLSLILLFSIALGFFLPNNIAAQVGLPKNTEIYEARLPVWRGFVHEWTYNHRFNRQGSRVWLQDLKGGASDMLVSEYAAASGTGTDSAYAISKASLVRFNGGAVQQGQLELELAGRERKPIQISTTLELALDSNMRDFDSYQIILNGFDLVSLRRADKLIGLRLSFGDGGYDPEKDKLVFPLNIYFLAGCNSLECPLFVQKVEYALKLNFAVIGYKTDMLNVAQTILRKEDYWDRRTEYLSEPPTLELTGEPDFPAAVMAFKGFSIQINKPRHLHSLHVALDHQAYDPETGTMRYVPHLFFKQWAEGMKKESAYPKYSRFSVKAKGVVEYQAELAMLQFKQASVYDYQQKFRAWWVGRNQEATSDEALTRQSWSASKIAEPGVHFLPPDNTPQPESTSVPEEDR